MMLAVLIASFDFSGASPQCGHNLLVTRPYVDNQFSKGQLLPLLPFQPFTDVALRTPTPCRLDSTLSQSS